MREFIILAKAIADDHRVRILLALRRQELCVCQITALFGLAPSTVSKHLSILLHAGLVDYRKDGRWIFYRRPDKSAPARVRQAIAWVETNVANSPPALTDLQALEKVLKTDPAVLCKIQTKS